MSMAPTRPRERIIRRPIVHPEKVVVKYSNNRARHPVREPLILALGFLATILIGSLLLTLPAANREGVVTPYIVALFTSTSAVCVTGLVVVDTEMYWTPFGQAVIVGLIQVGGLGWMTASTFLLAAVGRRVGLADRLLLRAAHGVAPLGGVLRLTQRVVLVTAIIEGVGALILFLRFAQDFSLAKALWMGVFHSVSAFNNAGFDIIGGFKSLTPYNQEPVVLPTIAFLIILGGISYTVLLNVGHQRAFRYLLLDTKLVLLTTGFLLAAGTVGLLIMEYANQSTLGPMDIPAKLLNAFFSSTTPRTAGFNSIDVGRMTQGGIFLTIALMFIGAASGSTGGGIKVNTFAVLVAVAIASVKGRESVTAFGRRLPPSEVNRAFSVALLAFGLIFGVTLVLTAIEPFTLPQLLFETTSAFGTVGLSTGITPNLSLVGKLLIITTMYLGRVGPLTAALALLQRGKPETCKYPAAEVKIG
ncbi:MAG: Trk family potassium uptake protein [Chloroflexi bacterium]|nr:Trk family potassium uptake protein [Chloroflexota bacterium]